jgi:hypothetical protein
VNELAQADAARRLSSAIARYSKTDLLCPDEFGCLNLNRKGAKLLSQYTAPQLPSTPAVRVALQTGHDLPPASSRTIARRCRNRHCVERAKCHPRSATEPSRRSVTDST